MCEDASFMGYRRRGSIRPGVRNELWVIPAAGCVKGELRYILSRYHKPYWIDSVKLIDCQPTCGDGFDADTAADMLIGLARSPNAAGALFVGLGCEKLSVTELYDRALAGDCRVMRAVLDKNSEDAVPGYLDDLAALSPRVRESFPISDLCVGMIPARGGYSGLTANPMLARLSGRLAAQGSVILAAGTPEKGTMSAAPVMGESPVTGFLDYGEAAPARAGVAITPGSRDEAVNCTLFTASGAQIILFATAGGTPFGSVIPTVKISAASELVETRPGWIDFDAGPILNGESIDDAAARLEEYVLRTACGERAAHERKGFGEAAMPGESYRFGCSSS